MRTTPAQRHLLKIQASKSAMVAAAIAAGDPPANDNGGGQAASEYERMLGQLAEDRKQLKAIQSVEKKIELKAVLVGHYASYVDQVLLASKAAGAGAQDEVLVYQLIWNADVGNWPRFLELAEHALRYRLHLPEQHQRNLATFIAEETADAASKAIAAGRVFPEDVLEHVEILVEGEDMADQVKAKLHKALGQLALKRAETPLPEGASVAGFPRSAFAAAREHLVRALELNDKVGVKKDLERVERELKKESTDVG